MPLIALASSGLFRKKNISPAHDAISRENSCKKKIAFQVYQLFFWGFHLSLYTRFQKARLLLSNRLKNMLNYVTCIFKCRSINPSLIIAHKISIKHFNGSV